MKIKVKFERIGPNGIVTRTPSVYFDDRLLGEYLISPDCEDLRAEIGSETGSFNFVREWDTERIMQCLGHETKQGCNLTQVQRYFLLSLLSSLPAEVAESLLDAGIWESHVDMCSSFQGSGRYLSDDEKQEIYEIVAGGVASAV